MTEVSVHGIWEQSRSFHGLRFRIITSIYTPASIVASLCALRMHHSYFRYWRRCLKFFVSLTLAVCSYLDVAVYCYVDVLFRNKGNHGSTIQYKRNDESSSFIIHIMDNDGDKHFSPKYPTSLRCEVRSTGTLVADCDPTVASPSISGKSIAVLNILFHNKAKALRGTPVVPVTQWDGTSYPNYEPWTRLTGTLPDGIYLLEVLPFWTRLYTFPSWLEYLAPTSLFTL